MQNTSEIGNITHTHAYENTYTLIDHQSVWALQTLGKTANNMPTLPFTGNGREMWRHGGMGVWLVQEDAAHGCEFTVTLYWFYFLVFCFLLPLQKPAMARFYCITVILYDTVYHCISALSIDFTLETTPLTTPGIFIRLSFVQSTTPKPKNIQFIRICEQEKQQPEVWDLYCLWCIVCLQETVDSLTCTLWSLLLSEPQLRLMGFPFFLDYISDPDVVENTGTKGFIHHQLKKQKNSTMNLIFLVVFAHVLVHPNSNSFLFIYFYLYPAVL